VLHDFQIAAARMSFIPLLALLRPLPLGIGNVTDFAYVQRPAFLAHFSYHSTAPHSQCMSLRSKLALSVSYFAVTIATVHRPTFAWLKGDFGFLAALSTYRWEHLSS